MNEFKPNTEGVFYDVPASVYHAAPGISQSTLKAFDDAGSPLHFKKVRRKPASAEMQFGTLVHAAVLEGQAAFEELYYLRPEEYPAKFKGADVMKPWSGNSDWCKEWLEKHSDRIVLDKETLCRVNSCADALRANTGVFSKALASPKAHKEVSFFKRDEETGLLLKARVDVLVEDANGQTVIFDPKKVGVGCGNESEFQKQVKDYGYHIQAASYLEITGASAFYFVPFDDDEPFECNIWSLSPQWLELGRLEYRRILRAFAECWGGNNWPGYPRDGQELSMPDYLKKRITALTAVDTIEYLKRLPVKEGGAI